MIGILEFLAAFSIISLIAMVVVVAMITSRWSRGRDTDEDDARVLQEVYQGLEKLESRIEALETILLDHEPAAQEEEKR